MDANIILLQKRMKKKLDECRYEHTLGVMYTAAALAMVHHVDLDQAMFAGLLHDCAKCYTDERKIQLCEKYEVELTDAEKANTALIHAKLGACLAQQKYEVKDAEVIHAILTHTTGAPAMNNLDKIIFIADYIEPHREKAPHLNQLRTLAFQDLDQALILILEDTLKYLNGTGKSIDPMTRMTYDYYMNGADTL